MASKTAFASLPAEIVNAIRDASFPESEEVLSSSINESSIPPLVGALDTARGELSDTVRTVSRQEAGDVDGWIEQAKRVQEDIARCKEDAHHIIQEHERVEALRNTREQTRSKSSLLQAELAFNETLEKQILLISETSASLAKVQDNIEHQQLLTAAQTLPSITKTIDNIPGTQSRVLLSRMHSGLEQKLSEELQRDLDDHILTSATHDELSFQILPKTSDERSLSETPSTRGNTKPPSLDHILESMTLLGLRDHAIAHISHRVETALLAHLYRRSKAKINDTLRKDGAIAIRFTSNTPATVQVFSAGFEFAKYLHDLCPTTIRVDFMQKTLSWILPLLVSEWLDPAVPVELDHLMNLSELQNLVEHFDMWLKENGYGKSKELDSWAKKVPKTWLSKRRNLALDAVRSAFRRASGATRLVDRIERQTVNTEESQSADDDWANTWEDDDDQKDTAAGKRTEEKSDGDDGSDAWGFDADDHVDDRSLPSTAVASGDAVQDDEVEAWGWGDEDDSHTKAIPSETVPPNEPNGLQPSKAEARDLVLKESYSITDIPDYIIEQIGKDLTDNHRLRESPSTYVKSAITPLPDLASLPTLTLAMFRAIAASSYQSEFSPPLSNMHLYNDSLYLAAKLIDTFGDSSTEPSHTQSTLPSQTPLLEKFARQVYTSEISTHRTILLDLLDTAQGFVSCTRSPYSETCETAIISTTEYLRSIHSQWSSILSPSHLYQSIGNLLNSIMRKMIEDIEDMEDVSEPESRKLLTLCEPVSALQDLFITKKPTERGANNSSQEEGAVSMIAVHCGSYLRFQYLQQILESNLVEIKYLWTDAGLSLEFRPEEVVDLIQALFTESPQRRSAINTIKSGT